MLKKSNAPKGLNREKIRKKFNDGYCIEALSRMFNCRTNAIMHHVYDLTIPCITISKRGKFSDKKVKSIRTLYIKKKIPATKLSKQFEVSVSTILGIVHGKFYRWVPGKTITRYGMIVEIPKGFYIKTLPQRKGAMKPGPNNQTKRMVKSGGLLYIAKKYGVSNCTISRWAQKGKINLKRELKGTKYAGEPDRVK